MPTSESTSPARKRRTRKRRLARWLALAVAVLIAIPIAARTYLHFSSSGRVYSQIARVPHCHVAVVLGAKVRPNGTLSTLLEDRVDAGIKLYRAGKVEKLLMSGDNRFIRYNEPMRMRDYAIEHGVPPEDVAMDFAGRRTYDSMYRAKHIFGQDRFIIVSQGFHVDRAVFLCRHIGVRGYGLDADKPHHWSLKANVRELGASLGALVDVYLRNPRPVMGKRERI